MAQKKNLNINPYYDDFDGDNNYYKVLFKPGYPVQARELTTLQSILQDQVESFGSHIFKEGSVVIPGGVTYDGQFYAVKLNSRTFGVDVSLYINKLLGKKITGRSSGTTATVRYIALPNNANIKDLTIYVKYIDSDNNFIFNQFIDGEDLIADDNITYGNTVISGGTPFASLVSKNATSIGSAASIDDGVYFIRGYFVNVNKQTLLLDEYSNTPSYRVGLKIDETVVAARDDSSLYDNAKGFSNYAAPGADRLKINLTLTKKLLSDTQDTDFVEVLRVNNGRIKKVQNKTQYNLIEDYIAKRTYEESGNYAVNAFEVSAHNSLNNKLGNGGLFFETQKTEELNTPSDDLMSLMVSPGKAYVHGYDVETTGTTILDVQKPRDVREVVNANVPFRMGNILRVNNVQSVPTLKGEVDLQDLLKGDTDTAETIGKAKVYSLNLIDSTYSGASSKYDLYLYDVQTYTKLTLSSSATSSEIAESAYIKGKSSGASGYAIADANGSANITLTQTSGSFIQGEQITVNGIDFSRTISSTIVYGTQDIKSVTNGTFSADSFLERFPLPNGVVSGEVSGGNTIKSPGGNLSGIKKGTILRFSDDAFDDEQFVKVTSDSTSTSITIEPIGADVTGVYQGTNITTSGSYSKIEIGAPIFRNQESSQLYEVLSNSNVSSVNLSNSSIKIRESVTINTDGNGDVVLDTSSFSGIGSVFFEPFSQSRYQLAYSDGTIGAMTSDSFTLNSDGNSITIKNLTPSQTGASLLVTLKKVGIKNKVKDLTKSQILTIDKTRSVSNTSLSGLSVNNYYGLRVEDNDISLNVPDVTKVLAIYESTDSSKPTLDEFEFNATVNVSKNVIIGENIVSDVNNKVVARVVENYSTNSNLLNNNTLGIVYLSRDRFLEGEEVRFEESNIITNIKSINASTTAAKYKNITNAFTLDKGQKEHYYDYSKIVRNINTPIPSKQLLIVYDYFNVPNYNDGDVFSVLSYPTQSFSEDIPLLGKSDVRASDTLDFRFRVRKFDPTQTTDKSPFYYGHRTGNIDGPTRIIAPNESSLLGYSFYLGRIDKLYIDTLGKLFVQEGVPSISPKEPSNTSSDVMEIATIDLPPYLYDPKNIKITLTDNKRYTMRDIGTIEDRVENLETVTSLSLLELNTQTLQIRDAEGNDSFKSGFFVDDFRNNSLIDLNVSSIEVNTDNNEMTPLISKNTLKNQVAPATDIPENEIDFSTNFDLLDSNVQKTGNAVTLKYESIGWIEQPLATKVENVNPFHVVSYIGFVKLSPSTDRWVRTIRLPNRSVSGGTIVQGSGSLVRVSVQSSTRDVLVSSGEEEFMRSRNTEFSATNIKPLTKFYQFLDGNGELDFIPKLIEIANDSTLQNYGSASGSFKVGEDVFGYIDDEVLIKFRVAQSNHKYGPFNAPDTVFNINPYIKSENLQDTYSQSSKVLNVDTFSLSEEAQGKYYGYLTKGMKLVGQETGAISYVKDLRLISDNYGDLIGSFFIRDPHTDPSPTVRISTGSKNYKITSSSSNAKPLPGSKLISSAETTYKAEGTWQERQFVITNTTVITYYDPLAQSFSVGGKVEAPDLNGENDDSKGAFLTAVDLFFGSKPDTNDPVRIEIRTVELGTPTRTVLGTPKTLRPSEVNTSAMGETATHVVFDSPIYLEPGKEYAIVAVAETTDQYELWTAEMGEKTINTQSLPDAESVRYTKQFALGSLFKSQNGSIWTSNQYQDLKFKLYKAKFTSNSGVAYFYNPTLDESNGYVETLGNNPIRTLPKTGSLQFNALTNATMISNLSAGVKLKGATANGSAVIVGSGTTVDTATKVDSGSGYSGTFSNVNTFNITGSGTGLRFSSVGLSGDGVDTATIDPNNQGFGYVDGDIVGIETGNNTGTGARFRVNVQSGSINTLFLTNIQGELTSDTADEFAVTDTISYYDQSNQVQSSGVNITGVNEDGNKSSGNFIRVNHFDHGMYADTNKIELFDLQSSYAPTKLTSELSAGEQTTVSIANTSIFSYFEGVPVSDPGNLGYVKIGDEIIEYSGVGENTLTIKNRGKDNTKTITHESGLSVHKYELNGVSLRRINTDHTISSTNITADGYDIEIQRDSTKGTDRSSDGTYPQLSFFDDSFLGGVRAKASQNILFSEVIPTFDVVTPGSSTSISGSIRTISGTSVDGNEVSFIDKGFENVEINKLNSLSSTRMVASSKNESEYLTTLPRNKSFTTGIKLSTSDENLSPIIYLNNCVTEFRTPRLNNPISDYSSDSRVKSIIFDPHASVYVSNLVSLQNPANSLKVLLSAYRHSSADIRVLYQLIKPDSSEVEQEFELFPGYDNLAVANENGFNVVDPSKNSGRSDFIVRSSLQNEFLEYQFSADNLELFTGYRIKIVLSGTDFAHYPRIKDLRTIALR